MKLEIRFQLIVLLLLSGCQFFRAPDETGPKKFLILWAEPGAEYRMQEVEVRTLDNMSRMEGAYAKIRYNQSSDQVAPEAHFTQLANGVYVPRDAMSAQLVGVYAHMERLGEMEDRLGLGGVLNRPRFVSIETSIDLPNGQRQLDNATYFVQWDLVAIVPNSSRTLPISLNGGILAHEHFHAIFAHLVLKQFQKFSSVLVRDDFANVIADDPKMTIPKEQMSVAEKDLINNDVILRGLNEGLADYWAWLYTRDPNFLEKSIPLTTNRAVLSKRIPLPDRYFFIRGPQVSTREFAAKKSYALGTRFAGIMRAFAEEEGAEQATRQLIAALPTLAGNWKKLAVQGVVSPNILLGVLFANSNNLTKARCCLAENFLSEDYDDFGVLNACQKLDYSCESR